MDMMDLIQKASEVFDEMLQTRHEAGGEKYGPLKFLEANTVEEAMEELVDLANYARYTYIKLYLMNQALDEALGGQEITIPGSFSAGKPDIEVRKDNQ